MHSIQISRFEIPREIRIEQNLRLVWNIKFILYFKLKGSPYIYSNPLEGKGGKAENFCA